MPVKYAFVLTFVMVSAILFIGIGFSSLDRSIAGETVVNGYAVYKTSEN